MVNNETEWSFQCLVVSGITKTKYRSYGSLCFLQRSALLPFEVFLSFFFFLNFLFPSHITLRVKWRYFTVFPGLNSSTYKTSGMPFMPFKVSTSFHKLFLGVPGESVIMDSQTNPLSYQEATPALLPSCSDPLWWSRRWALVSALTGAPCQENLSQCHPLFQCLAPPGFDGSASGCCWSYGWWMLSKIKLQTPALTAAGVLVGMMCWTQDVSSTQCPIGHSAHFNVIQDTLDF